MRRRIDSALAAASPLALAEAMDAHIGALPLAELRALIERSAARMDAAHQQQLAMYVRLEEPDELLAHRFSAFLRHNPRALAALDPDAVDAILADFGQPAPQHRRVLPPRLAAIVGLAIAVALLPLAAQYVHQKGLLEGLAEPVLTPPVAQFVQRIMPHHVARPAHAARARRVLQNAPKHAAPIAHRAARPLHARNRHIARHVGRRPHRRIAWKFSPENNPYFNRLRWRHPFVDMHARRAAFVAFAERAKLSVRSYLRDVIAGNYGAAFAHLGMRADSNPGAIAELPIVSRRSIVWIAGTRARANGVRVRAVIRTGGREYYEFFDVARDGPAVRILDRYYVPANRRAQVALRSLVQNTH